MVSKKMASEHVPQMEEDHDLGTSVVHIIRNNEPVSFEAQEDDEIDDQTEKERLIEETEGGTFERALQKSGRGSMALVLPHSWINKSGLKVHDKIFLKWQTDGSLRIAPMKDSERERGIFLIDANQMKQPHGLGRTLISAYVEGFNRMKISGNGGLTKQQYDDVLAHASKLIGLAIIGESLSNIEIKCYLDPLKNDVPQLFVRIYSLSSAMLKDSLEAFTNQSQDSARRAKGMDAEVDRIYYLILRQLFTAARDPIIAESLKISRPLNIVSDRSIAQLIEDIGDTCHNTCTKLIAHPPNQILPQELLIRAQELSGQICSIYDRAFRAYSLTDRRAANSVIDDCRIFEKSVEEFEKVIYEKAANPVNYALISQYALVSRHCRSIAEIAFNKAVGVDKEHAWIQDNFQKE